MLYAMLALYKLENLLTVLSKFLPILFATKCKDH